MKDIQNIPAFLRVFKCFQKCKSADLESMLLPSLASDLNRPNPLQSQAAACLSDAPAHTVSRALNARSPLLPKSLKKKKTHTHTGGGGGGGREGRKKKKVEILREAEGKKGGSPVMAVKSFFSPLHLSSSFSLTSPLFPLSLSVSLSLPATHPQLSPDVPVNTPLTNSTSSVFLQALCIIRMRSNEKGSRKTDE